jgi:predicted ester cyclase
MANKDSGAVFRQTIDLFNKHDVEGSLPLIASDAVIENVPFGTNYRGSQGFKEYNNLWLKGFPDAKLEGVNIISLGEYVVAEFTGRGTQTGVLSGPAGDINPTNKRVEVRCCEVAQVKDGKIVNIRLYFDAASLMRQLGIAAAAPSAAGRRQPEQPPPTRTM